TESGERAARAASRRRGLLLRANAKVLLHGGALALRAVEMGLPAPLRRERAAGRRVPRFVEEELGRSPRVGRAGLDLGGEAAGVGHRVFADMGHEAERLGV